MAYSLGKFHYEVEAMPAVEYDEWLAFFKIKSEEEEKQQKEAQRKSKSKGR